MNRTIWRQRMEAERRVELAERQVEWARDRSNPELLEQWEHDLREAREAVIRLTPDWITRWMEPVTAVSPAAAASAADSRRRRAATLLGELRAAASARSGDEVK